MSRGARLLRLLLGLQLALCIVAAADPFLRQCASCFRGFPGPALLGIAYYGALFARACVAGISREVHWGILIGAAAHGVLLSRMSDGGPLCGLCLTAAALSAGMVAVSVIMDRASIGRLVALTPAAILAIVAGRALPVTSAQAPAEPGQLRISIFTQPDCPYCDDLQRRVMPEIVREFGERVATEYRSADDLPAVRRTPTIILQSARAGVTPRIIEGLPTVDRLRGVIRDLEAAP